MKMTKTETDTNREHQSKNIRMVVVTLSGLLLSSARCKDNEESYHEKMEIPFYSIISFITLHKLL